MNLMFFNLRGRIRMIARAVPDLLTGHAVITTRGELGKAWRDQVKPHALEKEPDVSGAAYDSAFNDMCKQIGLAEGK